MCGGGSSSTNSTTNQNSSYNGTTNSSTTPNTPDWLSQPWQDYTKTVGGLPSYTVPGATPLQSQAFTDASGMTTSPYFSSAADLVNRYAGGYTPSTMTAAQVGPVTNATATSAAGGVGSYLNPYQSVVNSDIINEMERGRELAQTNNGQGAVAAGQYGGSRQGVLDSNLNRDFLTTLGNTIAGNDQAGYTTALGAAQQDANRNTDVSLANAGAANQAAITQAGLTQGAGSANQTAMNQGQQFGITSGLTGAGLLGGLGTSSGTQQLQQTGLLGDLGSTQYGIAQNQAQAPYAGAGLLGSLLGQVPSNLFVGSNTNGTQSGTGTGTGTTQGKTSTSPGLFDWMSMLGGNFSKAASAGAGAGG